MRVGEVRLAVREYGQPAAPTVLLVHGYPDNQSVWDAVVTRLAGRFHVVTYDVRGAGASTVPRGAASYRLARLAADLLAVADATSQHAPVHLVGHDWGSTQAWELVTDPSATGRIASFTTISGPCLEHFQHQMRQWLRHRRDWPRAGRQLARSWYIGVFLLPSLAELGWRSGLFGWSLVRSERLPVRPSPADGVHGLALYRANMRGRPGPPRNRRTELPVQVVVPAWDRYIGPDLLADLERWAPRLIRRDLDAGHWVQHSHPDLLARWITEFAGLPAGSG